MPDRQKRGAIAPRIGYLADKKRSRILLCDHVVRIGTSYLLDECQTGLRSFHST